MKKIFLIFLLLLNTTLIFSEDIDFTFEPGDTYIPISDTAKNATYWTMKSVMWGTTIALATTIYVTPFLPEGDSKDSIWAFFATKCHQDYNRTMRYKCVHQSPEYDFPVCARCQGLYTGYALGFVDSFIWDSFQIKDWERWEQGLLHIGVYSLLAVPMVVDGYVQKNTDYVSNNPWRFINGFMFGYAVTAIVDECIQLVLDKKSSP